METRNGFIVETLASSGYSAKLCSFSALDNYLELPSLPFVLLETSAGITDLARIVEELRFPGMEIADGATDAEGLRWYFRCIDGEETQHNPSYNILSLVQDLKSQRFYDSRGIYPQIRSLRNIHAKSKQKNLDASDWWEDLLPGTDYFQALMDGSLILARYEAAKSPPSLFIETLGMAIDGKPPPSPETQQVLLVGLMASPQPERGFELLNASGFLDTVWPEIARLDRVSHSKEYHPEGNAWKHTVQTFGYRKQNAAGKYDLRLSLALLLHDIGKPMAGNSGSRRFDGHAEIGARAAARFLERLEFDPGLVEDVFFLVKNHMLPAALARLPLFKTREIMNSHLFPVLMELYRCDESSSFKGLDNYYENSAAYKTYLRNSKNPYRSADGKILDWKR